ncbi:uncharacterized protein LOC141948395 isoform X2 [Strix uralensis]|uniref:uncharacterized protein LOC141948395 isoform X2 n=1 Tax=Strix uralensis TaxID=36305 RepID=UPI003DA69B57
MLPAPRVSLCVSALPRLRSLRWNTGSFTRRRAVKPGAGCPPGILAGRSGGGSLRYLYLLHTVCVDVSHFKNLCSLKSLSPKDSWSSDGVGVQLCQPEQSCSMPVMCYSKKETQFPARSPGPHWAPCRTAVKFSNPSVNVDLLGMETLCKPQYLPPVSHLNHITEGAALLTVSSGPADVFRARGQTCPPKPSDKSRPLEDAGHRNQPKSYRHR